MVSNRNRNLLFLLAAVTSAGVVTIRLRSHMHQLENRSNLSPRNKDKVRLRMWKDIARLLKLLIPGPFCKEAAVLTVFMFVLAGRTMLSIYVATLEGSVIKAIVNRDRSKFVDLALFWLAVGIPAIGLNSVIRYLNSTIAMLFRRRLTKICYDLYMSQDVYYKVGNLDDRLTNPDQSLTDDLNKFCEELAMVLSSIGKPVFDIVLFVREIVHGIGSKAILGATAITVATAGFLHFAQPSFGHMIARRAQAEGELRFAHVRLITNAEEIAFQRGEKIERLILDDLQRSVRNIVFALNTRRAAYSVVEGYLLKYVWGIVGFITSSYPIFFPQAVKTGEKVTRSVGDSTEALVVNRRLLTGAADAVERLMESLKELSHIAGFANRLAAMLDVFEDVSRGKCQHTVVANTIPMKIEGQIVDCSDMLEFDRVPIVSPNGEVLIPYLSFKLARGQHLLVTGPNGSGKSSLFRILGGLWPVVSGTVRRPLCSNSLYFLPQRPYLVAGSFLDQVIYPHTADTCKRTKEELEEILQWCCIENVLQREGWDKVAEWKDVLSGGEKQKVGMARLLYHRPMFAVCDECTSAVSVDVEGRMYEKAVQLGITLLSVSHRRSIWKYHTHSLTFDGHGGYKFDELHLEQMITLTQRKTQLVKELHDINSALGEDMSDMPGTPVELQ